jgi:SDR family mycofactocin-dependent oxidoreductase
VGLLDGKVALVTGGARGQGRSHAVRLAEEGADVVVVDVAADVPEVAAYPGPTEDDLAETARLVEGCGRKAIARPADVRDRAALQAVVDEALETFGHLDAVLANAGVCPPGAPTWEIPEDQWAAVLAVNLTGVFNTVSVCVPPMLAAGRGGAIVITSSSAAMKSPPNMADYAASKHGVIGLMETLAVELGPHRIRVNAICPAAVDTTILANEAMYRLVRPDLEHPGHDDIAQEFAGRNPIPEPWVQPRDVSNFVVWLVSDQAWYLTGATLPLDMGHNVRW